jgi:hypothetical protein
MDAELFSPSPDLSRFLEGFRQTAADHFYCTVIVIIFATVTYYKHSMHYVIISLSQPSITIVFRIGLRLVLPVTII